MGYYTIRLDPDATKICTILFPWGGIFLQAINNGFQRKMPEHMESLEYVWAYLDDLLCISRKSRKDHLEKPEEVLRCLHDVDFEVNAENSAFCALEIEYLGYTITRDGIKPQSNKLQAILAIQLPKGLKQLQHFLGMVQYYSDPWVRRSKILAPLTVCNFPGWDQKLRKHAKPLFYNACNINFY